MTAAEYEHSHLFDPSSLAKFHLITGWHWRPMTRVSATYTGEATDKMAATTGLPRVGFGLLITEGIYTDTTFSQGNLYQPGLALPEPLPLERR
ncbi:hypothetical protein [Arthrobacter sp. B1I2]|uniref:hypothetical protein n=1 Tax=Arthrobacter sp. B1I2 TaxID=3042263 RepID=UPI0027872813|nr:hypothetical protein [Arthrobacter sp. B1I2]MDQ0733423.1 2,4-dienoyl-CoA reductase-like NADH-dependent reductase (Old Yellow Enzyme family) [Arthrobacter sp. B1I2]